MQPYEVTNKALALLLAATEFTTAVLTDHHGAQQRSAAITALEASVAAAKLAVRHELG